MSDWKLKFDGGERDLDSGLVTFGRSTDNDVSFAEDTNVSRFHAEIENRHGDYFLIDLGSSNGTSVNGSKVNGEIRLKAGDKILFGGSSAVEIVSEEESAESNEAINT